MNRYCCIAVYVVCTLFLFIRSVLAGEVGTIYDNQHNKIGYWRYDRSRQETIIFDDKYNPIGYLKRNTGYKGRTIKDRLHENIGETLPNSTWDVNDYDQNG